MNIKTYVGAANIFTSTKLQWLLNMPQAIIDLLKQGAEANLADVYRQGNMIYLPADVQFIATGDIHGHQRNFERIVAFADLTNQHDKHVVLQEIIHGGPEDSKGGCLSYKLLFDVVRYKLSFPNQVHIIMGNHDATFINNSEVMKEGKEMNRSMRLALKREFHQASSDIEKAIEQFFFSQPLAVKTDNRIWLSHSLPNDRYVDEFDRQILDRELKIEDFEKPGSVYLLTWGRNMSQETIDKMAKLLDVDIFILGHQQQEKGWCQAGDNLLIITSEHNHGCSIPIDAAKSYTVEQLISLIVPLASIA